MQKVFSASSDSTVKVWDSSKGTLLNTMNHHKVFRFKKTLLLIKNRKFLTKSLQGLCEMFVVR
jgi:hypothetical protein